MTPLLLVLVALAVLDEALVLEEALLVVVAVELPEEAGAEVAPARGAVDWPSI
jgi:hypothetical protein